jgi:hypothetical protein
VNSVQSERELGSTKTKRNDSPASLLVNGRNIVGTIFKLESKGEVPDSFAVGTIAALQGANSINRTF